MPDQKIAIGGLMRCCLETVREFVNTGDVPEVGARLKCKYCSDYIVATQDSEEAPIIWRWPGLKSER